MPMPSWVARVNRRSFNHVTLLLSARVPWFATVVHRGRRSGREYRTPVNAFPTDGGFVVPLIYGKGADWVRNVIAANGCRILHRGRDVTVTDPRLVAEADVAAAVPAVVRASLRVANMHDYVLLSRAT